MIKILVTVIGIVISGILGIIATYLLTIRKVLRCIIVPSSSLIPVPKEVQGKTKIIYDNKPVENLSSTTVKIRNSGISYIDDKTFINHLQIVFNNDIKLLEHEILERDNPDRETKISVTSLSRCTTLGRFRVPTPMDCLKATYGLAQST